MRVLHLNEDIYDSVIQRLQTEERTEFANLLIKLRDAARIPEAVPFNATAEDKTEHNDGRLTKAQKEAIRIVQNGGRIWSLRWDKIVFCGTYYNGRAKELDSMEVEDLLQKKIIEGVPQNHFPDKDYILTDFGKTMGV